MSHTETFDSLTTRLEHEFRRWDHLYQYGGSDPFYADGVNLNLIRNHILSIKRAMTLHMEQSTRELTLFSLSYPEIYDRQTPPEIPNDYMARADEIRARAQQQLALYEKDPNFCYIRDHHRQVFPDGESTRDTKAASLYPSASGQTIWFRKYLEQDDLVALRRAFYEPYEQKAVRWADLAQKMKAFLSVDHTKENTTPIRDDYDDTDYPPTSYIAPDGSYEDEQESAAEPSSNPSLDEQIRCASNRAEAQPKPAPARDEQMTLF